MSMPRTIYFLILAFLVIATGCQSIRSDEVRQLIVAEGDKIDAAQRNITGLQKDTAERIQWMRKAVKDLNSSFINYQKVEAKHGLYLSKGHTLPAEPGQHANAWAYTVGKIYQKEYEGLNKTVREQFEEDFCVLEKVAASLSSSWKSLGTLHSEMTNYSNKSGFASIDPEFLSALIQQTPITSDQIDDVLDNSRTVNDALEEVVGARIIRLGFLERGHSVSTDLVNLLEHMKQ
jgi:hypothetical protein